MKETDVVIIGAGPCGLFQVFELGLLGLKAEVIDSIAYPGGQCAELYPDKPIYDIPGIPVCTGQELTTALLQQIAPFDPGMHLGEEVTELNVLDEHQFKLTTNANKKFAANAVVIAAGVGSFQPRKLRVTEAQQYEEVSLHYHVKQAQAFTDKRVVILGGGDSALDWTLEMINIAAHVTLIHRRDEYRAVDASVDKMRALVAQGKMDLYEKMTLDSIHGINGRIENIVIKDDDKNLKSIPADQVLVFYGLAPKLGPIANWGFELHRKTIPVDTEKFETSIAGVYAVGDINTYPGKKKLILSGFHEAALAAFAIKQRIEPDKKVRVQYTTTSPLMHERLGLTDH